MTREEPIEHARLVIENRQLRNVLEQLLNEFESAGLHQNGKSNGIDVDKLREQLPAEPSGIKPPWERQGYDSKDEWLAEKRGNDQ